MALVSFAAGTLPRLARAADVAGGYLALYGTVLVFVLIGGLKFTAYEAEAIRPLVETSPLLGWAYAVFSVRAFSNLLGVIELATAALLAVAPLAPRLGALGAAAAVGTFAVTSSFMLTGPVWEASLGGFPALSPAGGFIIKDLVLLGVVLSAFGRAVMGARRQGSQAGWTRLRPSVVRPR